ncbi:MAG TPA: hypothetical protein VMM13_19540 [Euzebya sp.]|nr:hypothetical protein [Euzebya sp.]
MSELTPLVRVTDVKVLARYIVELAFADGAVKVLDLEPHLWGEMFSDLRDDHRQFCAVTVDYVGLKSQTNLRVGPDDEERKMTRAEVAASLGCGMQQRWVWRSNGSPARRPVTEGRR